MANRLRRLKADWPVYGRGVLVLLTAIVLVATVIAFKALQFRELGRDRDRLQMDMQARQTQAQDADARLELLNGELADYSWVVKHGLLKPEARLDWVETVARQRQQSGKVKIGFTLTPQADFDWAPIDGVFAIRASHMALNIRARHEGWWLDLLTALANQSQGYPVVRKCHVHVEIIEGLAIKGDFTPLSADCDLDWLTMIRRPPPVGG